MTKLAEIMEVVSDPRAQAIAQLKEGLQRVLSQQNDIPANIELGLDTDGVILKYPDRNDINFENCMTLVCGLSDICDALKTLRPIDAVPYLSAARERIGFEEILKPVAVVLESRADASTDMQQKIEDYLAVSKLMSELSLYFAEGNEDNPYQLKAMEYKDNAYFALDFPVNKLDVATVRTNGLIPFLEPIEADITQFDEGRFVLSRSQTEDIHARIKMLAKAAIHNPKTIPATADMLMGMIGQLPPEDDVVITQLGAGLFDKMSGAAKVAYVTDLADLTISANNPQSVIESPILSRYATTVGELNDKIAKFGGVAQMLGLEPSPQLGLDLDGRELN